MKNFVKQAGISIAMLFLLSAAVFAADGPGTGGENIFANRMGRFGQQQMGVDEISAQELSSWIEEGKRLILIDISTAGEFREGHIKGSIHIDRRQMRGEPGSMVENVNAGKDDTLVFVCQTGNLSRKAAGIFKNEGYKNCFNLAGGKIAWIRAGYNLTEGDI